MTGSQQAQAMKLMHAIVMWKAPLAQSGLGYEECCENLHQAVDELSQETVNELTRIINGGVNLRSV
jgi:hypothetical protein